MKASLARNATKKSISYVSNIFNSLYEYDSKYFFRRFIVLFLAFAVILFSALLCSSDVDIPVLLLLVALYMGENGARLGCFGFVLRVGGPWLGGFLRMALLGSRRCCFQPGFEACCCMTEL